MNGAAPQGDITLARLTQQALEHTEPESLFQQTASLLAEAFHTPWCAIFEPCPEHNGLILRAGTGWNTRFAIEPIESHVGYALRHNTAVTTNDPIDEVRWPPSPLFIQHRLTSGAAVPIPGTSKPYGVLAVYSRASHAFHNAHIAFLKTAAGIVALALSRIRAIERRRFLAEASALLSGSLDCDTTLSRLSRLVVPTLADCCLVQLATLDGSPRRMAVAHRDPDKETAVRKLLSRTDDTEQALRSVGARSSMQIALVARGHSLGTLTFAITESSRHYDTTDLALAEELARHAALAVDNALLYEIERSAHARAHAAQKRLEFLAEASNTLGTSLEYDVTLRNVALLPVPSLADHCLVHVQDDDGTIRCVAETTAAVQSQHTSFPDPSSTQVHPGPVYEVLRTGRTVSVPEITDDSFRSIAHDSAWIALVRRTSARAALFVPLVARGRTFGVLSCLMGPSGRNYTPDDTALIEELARRAALAVDNAVLYRQAQQAIRARDDFLSVASHELKTPLTALHIQVSSILRRASREQENYLAREPIVSGLRIAERQGRRLAQLIDNLLDVSRITAGRLDLEFEDVDLVDVVHEVLNRHEEELTRARCTPTVNTDGPVVGHWDRFRLDQVVTNLVSNAVKYGAGRPVEISVQSDTHTATLTVRDHGIGIAPEHQARIFGRFERVVSSRHYGGFGLGLWIVRQIVEAFDGSIEVSSQPGAGSTFTVRLPRFKQARRK